MQPKDLERAELARCKTVYHQAAANRLVKRFG